MNEFATMIHYGSIAIAAGVFLCCAAMVRLVWIAARRLMKKGERNAD